MSIFELLTLLSILSGMLTPSQRRLYLKQFAEVLAQLHSGGNIYLPPWIRHQLIMSGMRKYVARRLICLPNGDFFCRSSRTSFKFYSYILGPSLDFYRYQHHICDPQRLVVNSTLRCDSPLACCWHPGLRKLLVTTQTHIFMAEITGPNPRFEVLYSLPGGNNYGIDVANDGTIVLIGYNANRIFLISPRGKLIGNHVIVPNSFTTYSGVSFSHDDTHILCFSRNGIHILRRNGTFLCTVGGEGSKPGFFRGEGQIFPLAKKNQFAISDIENNRIQIVEIDFGAGTMKVLNILGTNFFFKPLGIVEMGNCIVAFSHDDGCAYVSDGERNFQVLDGKFVGVRFACKLPGGCIALCNKNSSEVHIIKENYSVPSGIECLVLVLKEKSKEGLSRVTDSGVQTSVPMTQVVDSSAQTSVQPTQIADSPIESIFERFFNIVQYFLGYQLF